MKIEEKLSRILHQQKPGVQGQTTNMILSSLPIIRALAVMIIFYQKKRENNFILTIRPRNRKLSAGPFRVKAKSKTPSIEP